MKNLPTGIKALLWVLGVAAIATASSRFFASLLRHFGP